MCARAARPWWRASLGLRPQAFPGAGHETGLPRLAILYVPHYIVEVDVDSRKGPGTTRCLMDGCSGAFAIADFDAPPEPGDPDGEVLPALLDDAQARAAALETLTRVILGQRSRGPKPVPQGIRGSERVDWPFWVYYFPRRAGRLDIRACDARTAEPAGNRAKAGLLQAMVAAAGGTHHRGTEDTERMRE
ncbi:MAG: hypothetical protein GC168_05630 [Candidatus Hydrogenedens sp.]|nr:hypothetical protein [Candidatus Hydrogenedens sp.]